MLIANRDSGSIVGRLGLSLIAMFAIAAFSAATTQAEIIHHYESQIAEVPAGSGAALAGKLGEPQGLAVSGASLFDAERAESNGKGINRFSLASDAWEAQFPSPSGVFSLDHGLAVTGSGVVYVAGDEHGVPTSEGVVVSYSTAGALLSVWHGEATPAKEFGCFGCGVAETVVGVDNSSVVGDWAAGDLYVASPAQNLVDVFKPAAGGKEPATIVAQLTGVEGAPFAAVRDVAVDGSTGHVLVVDGNALDVFEPVSGAEGTYKFLFRITETPRGPFVQITSVAADGGNGEIYLAECAELACKHSSVDEYSATGSYLGRITGTDAPQGGFSVAESVAVDPASHDVFVGDRRADPTGEGEAEAFVDVFGPDMVVPSVQTQPATGLAPTEATLNGTVNAEGAGTATCRFQWGTTPSLGETLPCTSPIEGSTTTPVQARLKGLVPGIQYYFRLQASDANGTNPGEPPETQTFIAPGPTIGEASVTDVTSESATFHATIDPNNAPTSYFFQYGPTTAYGQTAPVSPAFLGEGSGNQETEPQIVSGLTTATVYHYRIVAISELSPGHSEQFPGPDRTFTTYGTGAAAGLPDGRQWELVSPVDKHGGLLEPIGQSGVIEASTSGDAITYFANGPTEASPEGYSNFVQVLSRRLSSSWASKDIATPNAAATGATGIVGAGLEYRFFAEDLSEALVQPIGPFTALSPAASEQTPYIRRDFPAGNVAAPCEPGASDCYRPLVSGCPASGPCAKAIEEAADVPVGSVFGDKREDGGCASAIFRLSAFQCRPRFVAATPDLGHVVIESETALTAGASGDELYELSGGRLELVGAASQGEKHFHAISGDGERVVFDGESEGLKGLLLRQTGKGKTLQLDAAEAKCLGEAGSECESGDGEFRWATPDARKIFFTDTHKLTSDAGARGGANGGAPDLYECEVIEHPGSVECALSDLTPKGPGGEAADAQGVLGASEDGGYLYYATGPEEERHVYVRHEGSSRLVGVLSQADASDWAARLKLHTARVSANGQWLAFLSQEPLTGYDTRDALSGKPDMEVYLYDAGANRLVCASCDPSGARPRGVEYRNLIYGVKGAISGGDRILPSTEQGVAAIVPGGTPITVIQSLYQSRYLSNSGRLFFNAEDALVPQDVNSTMDVYEYEPVGVPGVPAGSPMACSSGDSTFSARSGGCVSLISSGTSPKESAFLDAGETGGDVFFLTYSKLSSQDIDEERDVYDAHECGASSPCFPTSPETPPPCTTGESCKAAPASQPEIFGAPASATFSGIGNPSPATATVKVKAKPLTRVQKLSVALKGCTRKPKRQRKGCRAAAHRRYGVNAKSKSKTTGRGK